MDRIAIAVDRPNKSQFSSVSCDNSVAIKIKHPIFKLFEVAHYEFVHIMLCINHKQNNPQYTINIDIYIGSEINVL